MEKIFILIPWFLPAFKAGGPISSVAGMVKQLAGEGMEFSIFCSHRDHDGTTLDVPVNEWVPYRNNCRVWYNSHHSVLPALKLAIAKEKPRYLYIIGIYDWQYNIKPLLFIKGVEKIVSVRGMLHPGALSQKPGKKKIFLQLLKLAGWQRKYRFHVTDEAEKEYARQVLGDKANIIVAGNFPNLYSPLPLPAKVPASLKLFSVGLISPMKNYLLVLQALGQLKDLNIEYAIYGPVKDPAYWQQCLELIQRLPANIKVSHHGAVAPSAIEAAMAGAQVFVLPSKSENFGHAIAEALSAGRPVITSHHTPWNGLEAARAGKNVAVDDTRELAEAMAFFAGMDQASLTAWSAGAATYVQSAINIEQIKAQYRNLFDLG